MEGSGQQGVSYVRSAKLLGEVDVRKAGNGELAQ